MTNTPELNKEYFNNLKSTDLRNQVNTILDIIDKTGSLAEYKEILVKDFSNILAALKIISTVASDNNETIGLALELLNSGKDLSKINRDEYREEFYARHLDVAITKKSLK